MPFTVNPSTKFCLVFSNIFADFWGRSSPVSSQVRYCNLISWNAPYKTKTTPSTKNCSVFRSNHTTQLTHPERQQSHNIIMMPRLVHALAVSLSLIASFAIAAEDPTNPSRLRGAPSAVTPEDDDDVAVVRNERYLEEADQEPEDEDSPQLGATGRRLDCVVTYGGLEKLMTKRERRFSSKVFKNCMNRKFRNTAGGFHTDIVSLTFEEGLYEEEAKGTSRNLQGEEPTDGDRELRRRYMGIGGGMEIWWGCSSCPEDHPMSSYWRRDRMLTASTNSTDSSLPSGVTPVKPSFNTDPVTAITRSMKCFMRQAFKRKNLTIDSMELDCGTLLPKVSVQR